MEVKEVPNIKEGIMTALKSDDNLSKYKLAKDLNLSTATHINNFITGKTIKTRPEVMKLLYKNYGILVEDYKNSNEYKRTVKNIGEKINV